MPENPSYELLVLVKNMLNNEVDPLLETYSQNYQSSPELLQIISKLDWIINYINSQSPRLYGLYTCPASTSVTANGQIIDMGVSFGGNIAPNADGSISLPANSTFLVDAVLSGTFSVKGFVVCTVYNADTGSELFSINSVSEGYSSLIDIPEIRSFSYSSGSTPLRIGMKVKTKQASGTFVFNQYSTFIKVLQV